MSDLSELAADLGRSATAMERAAEAVVRAAGLRLEARLRIAGDLASNVSIAFPAPRTAVIGGTKRFGVAAEAGATPIRVRPADVSRAADQVADGLLAAATRLMMGGGR